MALMLNLLVLSALATPAEANRVDYRGYAEVVVETANARELELALALPGRVLNCHVRPGDPLVLLMAPEDRANLDASGLSYRVSVADAASAWDEVRDRADKRRALRSNQRADWFSDFAELDAIESYMEELQALAPERVSVEEVGPSHEGRTIRAIRLSNGHHDTDNPAFMILGTQHAREWLSPMVVMWFADRLAREYGSDDEVTKLLDKMDVVIVPVVNPDGYIYSWESDRYWRKNRNSVDLNRNWDAGWGTGNGGDPMSAETYPGTGAFSEKESKAVSSYAATISNLVGFADIHTPISSMLYPRGYTTDEPEEIESLRDWANEAAQAIEGVHGEAIQVFRPTSAEDPTGMGPQGGIAMDYMTDTYGFGWIFEMRGPDFQIDRSEIVPAAEENWAGFVVFATRLIERFGNETGGDDTSSDETTSTSTADSDTSSQSTSETTLSSGDSSTETSGTQGESEGSETVTGDSSDGKTSGSQQETGSGDGDSEVADSSGDSQQESGGSGGCAVQTSGGSFAGALLGMVGSLAWRRRRRLPARVG